MEQVAHKLNFVKKKKYDHGNGVNKIKELLVFKRF